MELLRGLWRFKSTIIFIMTPLILLLLPLIIPGKEALCAYCMFLMGVYWMTEVLPLAVTSFLPLILFPTLGLMKAGEVSKAYMSDTIWLFVGGLIIAVGVEATNLHKRISLRVLTLIGANPRSLMFGFMATTAFLSMWISNTATTAMMLPIVEAVTIELRKGGSDEELNEELEESLQNGSEETNFLSREVGLEENEDEPEGNSLKPEIKTNDNLKTRIEKGLAICVPYAASIGGTVTINGTGTNVVLAGQFATLFPNSTLKLSFAKWMIYSFPSALVFFFCAYLWLAYFYMGFNLEVLRNVFKRNPPSKMERRTKKMLWNEYERMGAISWSESTVLIIFIVTALLWLLRDPGFIPGWAAIFDDDFVDDGTVAVAMSSLLFFLPSKKPEFLHRSGLKPASPVPPVLSWGSMQRLFPWNVVLLLGGGFALAQGATASGLSSWLGEKLIVLGGIDSWLICLIVSAILCLFTEFTSNVATAALFIPILATLAQSIEVHPIYLLVPPVLATSMAFMLPVATPPNAIAFSYGHLQVIDMVKAGSLLNVVGVVIVTISINTYGVSYFDLDNFPDWARRNNSAL